MSAPAARRRQPPRTPRPPRAGQGHPRPPGLRPEDARHPAGILAKKQAELDAAKKAVMDARAQIHKKETQLKGMQEKTAELRVKLNAIKKQVEYDAIRNQLANDNLAQSKLQEEILETMIKADEQAAAVAAQEAEIKKLADEIAALKADIASKAAEQKASLDGPGRRHRRGRGLHPRGPGRAIPPQRQAARRRRHGRRRGRRLLRLLRLRDRPDDERADQRPPPGLLQDLRPILYLPEETVSATRRTGR